MREMSRADYLALTPELYLAEGFRGPDGRVRPALLGENAMAAATQLADAQASPQELAFTYEAIRALLPLHDHEPDAAARLQAALAEALATVARMIRQPNNEGILTWSRTCAGSVREAADIDALLAHIQAVLRLLELIAQAEPPDEPASEPASPEPVSDGPG
jgi:tryptophan 2,3-dioxygenase